MPAELELAIAPEVKAIDLVAGLELVIALAAGLARPIVPEVEAIAPAVAAVVRPTGPEAAELELIALALAAAGTASVAAMFLGAAVPAGVVPLAAEVVG